MESSLSLFIAEIYREIKTTKRRPSSIQTMIGQSISFRIHQAWSFRARGVMCHIPGRNSS